MDRPLVSVIIPAYNSAAHIAEAVGSVLSQSYGAVEAVVVDDGSTDGTGEVLRKQVRDERVRCIRQDNRGPGAARNAGIETARGAYIAFLDSDDVITPDSIEERMSLMTSAPGLRLVYANYHIRMSEDRIELRFDRRYLRKHRCLRHELPNGVVLEGNFPDLFDIPFDMCTDTVLAERGLVERTGGFRTDIRIGEDREMWIRLSHHAGGVIGYVRSPIACYNRYRSDLTRRDPVAYARERERLNRAFLESYGPLAGKRRVRKVINVRLSWIHYDLGSYHARNRLCGKAAISFLKSICFNPSNEVTLRRLAAMVVPSIFRNGLKRVVGSISRRITTESRP